jgi:MFS family permease
MAIGLAFLPNTIAMAVLSIELSARLITRFGARSVLLAGLTCVVAGLVLFTLSPMNANYLRDLLLPMVLVGVGAALSFTSISMLAMAGTTPSDAGLASGLLNTTTQVAAALGLAVMATLATTRSGQLRAHGQGTVAALSGAYHFTWGIGAGLVFVALLIAATLLKPDARRVTSEAPSWREETAACVASGECA